MCALVSALLESHLTSCVLTQVSSKLRHDSMCSEAGDISRQCIKIDRLQDANIFLSLNSCKVTRFLAHGF